MGISFWAIVVIFLLGQQSSAYEMVSLNMTLCALKSLQFCGKNTEDIQMCPQECRRPLNQLFRKYKNLTHVDKTGRTTAISSNTSSAPFNIWGSLSIEQPGTFLATCENVYIDFGANLGVQIRKLFEGDKYRNAGLVRKFRDLFGEASEARNQKTCAIAFEMNPKQQPRLREIAERYSARGWRTSIIAAAIAVKDGEARLSPMWGDDIEQSSKIFIGEETSRSWNHLYVPTTDVAKFLYEQLVRAPALANGVTRKVFVKMDVEGVEYNVLPHILKDSRIACAVNEWAVEWHPNSVCQKPANCTNISALQQEISNMQSCTRLSSLDDESFGRDPFPLPTRKVANPANVSQVSENPEDYDVWSIVSAKSFFFQKRNAAAHSR